MTTTETITYRLYEDADLPAVLELWEQHSGWGPISAETYLQWNFGGPCGKSLIVIAENESGSIVGQAVLAPSRLWVHGHEIKVLRIAAPILHESARQGNIRRKDHPAVQLVAYSFEAAWEQGYDLIYALPVLGWVPMLKMLPLFGLPYGDVTTYDCFSIPFETSLEVKTGGITIRKLSGPFDERYQDLWEQAVTGIPISVGVVRDPAWLKWKIASCNVFEAYREEQFIGYAAIDKKGLLVDFLAVTKEDLLTVLVAVHRSLQDGPNQIPGIKGIHGMLSPFMESVLEGVPYGKENYQFAFGTYKNIKKVDPQLLQLPDWYIMPND